MLKAGEAYLHPPACKHSILANTGDSQSLRNNTEVRIKAPDRSWDNIYRVIFNEGQNV